MDFIQSCRQFIAIDSSPTQGCAAAAEFAAQLCRQQGLIVELQDEHWGDLRQGNVIARPGQAKDVPELMLQTHLDTPDPGHFALWSKTSQNPFDAHIIDGRIYGLGTADAKLDFLCKLRALESFKSEKQWKVMPVLVGTFGEEIGMVGALKLIRKNKVNAKYALVGEPSSLRIINACKGIAGVEIRIPFDTEEMRFREEHNLTESASSQSKVFTGKAAHSASPQLGESAIHKMLEYMLMLPEDITIMDINGGVNHNSIAAHAYLEFDLGSASRQAMSGKINRIFLAIKHLEETFVQYEDQDFAPPQPTLDIGVIRTLDDHVSMLGTCRMPPSIQQEVYEHWMNDLKVACERVGADFKITDYKRPFRTSRESVFLQGCIESIVSCGLQPTLATQASTNEASLFSRVGIECISFGPGQREGNAHTPEESVALSELEKATEFYKDVIKRFCL